MCDQSKVETQSNTDGANDGCAEKASACGALLVVRAPHCIDMIVLKFMSIVGKGNPMYRTVFGRVEYMNQFSRRQLDETRLTRLISN